MYEALSDYWKLLIWVISTSRRPQFPLLRHKRGPDEDTGDVGGGGQAGEEEGLRQRHQGHSRSDVNKVTMEHITVI